MKNKTFRSVLLKYKSYLEKLLQYKIVQQSVLRMKDSISQQSTSSGRCSECTTLFASEYSVWYYIYFFSDWTQDT